VLLWRYPKGESAAQLGMTVLGGNITVARASLKAEDFTERARRLTDLRLYRLLALELGDSAFPVLDPDSARRLGRIYLGALLQIKANGVAADFLERGQAQQRFALDPKEVATWEVRVALRRRNIQQVLSSLKRLESLDPHADALAGFYLELARQYEQSGDVGPLTEWARRVIAASPGSNAAGTAYWMLVWSRYQRNDMAGARQWVEKALSANPPVPWDYQARLLYWKGRIAAVSGDAEGGRQAWADLVARWPSTYYGLVAQSSGEPPPARFAPVQTRSDSVNIAPTLEAVWRHPTLASALFAYAAGEDALAESLLQETLVLPLPKDVVRELAALFLVLNEHHLQQRLLANQGPYELVESRVGNSPAWQEAFPPAFWDIVVDEAGSEEISPHFILAIMREESRFKVKADSRAGAKGLMQVMPSTAIGLARKRRINLTEATLLLPEFNIPIGALYLRDVLKRFDWNPIFAAAAYNAGPGTVMRWAKQWGVIPFDEFVERIPFEETQSYVRRVYASYLIYKQLYP
jgi:soluble lytic murein transglycosylase